MFYKNVLIIIVLFHVPNISDPLVLLFSMRLYFILSSCRVSYTFFINSLHDQKIHFLQENLNNWKQKTIFYHEIKEKNPYLYSLKTFQKEK